MGGENEDVRTVPPDDQDEPYTGDDPGQTPDDATGPTQDEPPAPGGTIPPRD